MHCYESNQKIIVSQRSGGSKNQSISIKNVYLKKYWSQKNVDRLDFGEKFTNPKKYWYWLNMLLSTWL